MEHEFTKTIKEILKSNFGEFSDSVFKESQIIQYLNIKTKSANKGSKSRGSFANLYAIYVLIEDYLKKNYDQSGKYREYEGAVYSELFKRQRELPFGKKLQNHALNHRMNEEFKKYFSTCDYIPIIRNFDTNRYWFNENLIKIKIDSNFYNIANVVIQIINAYIEAKKSTFEKFIYFCENAQNLSDKDLVEFLSNLMEPNIDARVFEIVSYSILKYYYNDQKIYWGFEITNIKEENLKLFKTGRTNANDGGIDFVMKPLGRFFQVTETIDVNKYFLDIDKMEKYPITFVIKSFESIEQLRNLIQQQAERQYAINAVVKQYMDCIEEIINIPILLSKFLTAVSLGHQQSIMEEIIKQSKVEFNYEDDYDLERYEE
jgi:hypothetical protein